MVSVPLDLMLLASRVYSAIGSPRRPNTVVLVVPVDVDTSGDPPFADYTVYISRDAEVTIIDFDYGLVHIDTAKLSEVRQVMERRRCPMCGAYHFHRVVVLADERGELVEVGALSPYDVDTDAIVALLKKHYEGLKERTMGEVEIVAI